MKELGQWITVWLTLVAASAFNLDVRRARKVQGPPNSLFGYSVSLYREKGKSWLLVGAPRADASQPGTQTGGAVYRCSPDELLCSQIPFDTTGYSSAIYRNKVTATENKTNQFFGATLHSSGEDGKIVACAPRYVYHSINFKRRDLIGSCWVYRSSTSTFREFSPCRNGRWGYHRQGFCQAGFSAAITNDGRKLFIGGVGSYYWQGQVFVQDLLELENKLESPEGVEEDDDSYLGYSMALGEFTGDNSMDVALGVPRGNDLAGKVVLYTASLVNIAIIKGHQIGSYFGYCICVGDFNGDGLDDLVIGSPFYSQPNSKNGTYETGQITIVSQEPNFKFVKMQVINGTIPKGKFGMALTSLGDINKDGYCDFAVGTPFGGPGGTGAVYIYHGGLNGVKEKPTQVFTSKDVGAISTFGFSLSGGFDVDKNDYPDLIIGAYESDMVVYIRTRPIANVKASLKPDNFKINLEDKSCSLNDTTLVSCWVISLCLEYYAAGNSYLDPEINFVYNIHLDYQQQKSRAFFLLKEKKSSISIELKLQKNSLYCNSMYAYITNNIRDKLSPIFAKVEYRLANKNSTAPLPILNENQNHTLVNQFAIQKNCGKDNICIPNLIISASVSTQQIVIGSNKKIELYVQLENKGEDAYESMLYLTLPFETYFVNVDKRQDIPITCRQVDDDSVNQISCDVGNPIPANATINFKIILAPVKEIPPFSNLTLYLYVNSTNEEKEDAILDNHLEIQVPIAFSIELALYGISEPSLILFNHTSRDTRNPDVTHIYSVANKGYSTLEEAEVIIVWPSILRKDRPFLYLLDQPAIKGKGKCEPVPDINPLNLKSEEKSKNLSSAAALMGNHLFPYLRTKRSFEDDDDEECASYSCTFIHCKVFNLSRDEQVYFSLRAKVWLQSLREFELDEVVARSRLLAKVTLLPYEVDINGFDEKVFSVSTRISSEDTIYRSQPIPLWIIILAITIGLILLALLALALWKVGFFKRLRPDEKRLIGQKNGYNWVHGDEHL